MSLSILAVLGVWVYRHRRGDFWVLMGVTALVARIWTYHAWYDDLLLLLPMIALYRTTKRGPLDGNSDVQAGVLLGLTLLFMLAPGGLYLLPPSWNGLYTAGQTLLWIILLLFLLVQARRDVRVQREAEVHIGGK